jgi:hypothetical protein
METILEKIIYVGIVFGVAFTNCYGCQHMHKTKSITYVHNVGLRTLSVYHMLVHCRSKVWSYMQTRSWMLLSIHIHALFLAYKYTNQNPTYVLYIHPPIYPLVDYCLFFVYVCWQLGLGLVGLLSGKSWTEWGMALKQRGDYDYSCILMDKFCFG